ncbi:MAG: ATP phosphoribosyltransferase, partial [Bacteroidales bacterium]|nr:ATP phosphoribosyltransferase [Bacteroidales bacterium]
DSAAFRRPGSFSHSPFGIHHSAFGILPMLRIALPNKGSLSEGAVSIVSEAGYACGRAAKELAKLDSSNDVEFFFLRPRDIAVYVSRGVIDLGITGRDLNEDAAEPALEVLPLGFGRSAFRYAVPAGSGLTPFDIVKYTCAYCEMLRVRRPHQGRYKVVVGKDARISGKMVEELVCGTISACGIDVIKAGKASTPTTEMAVVFSGADGGIILTASHNPKEWNALKLLNEKGEFLTAEEGQAILDCAEKGEFNFAPVDQLGKTERRDFTPDHIAAVLALPQVDTEAVRKAGFTVVLDAINSVGNIIMPKLLQLMGVRCIKINGEPNGNFAHNPEPLPKNLIGLSKAVKKYKADLGISVDPDVDRLAFICENGEPFVEVHAGQRCRLHPLTGGGAGPEGPLHRVQPVLLTRTA